MDRIFHLWYYLRLWSSAAFCSMYCRLFYKLRGIRLGKKIVFIGLPFIYKFPGSSISIGNSVEIRTSATSNLIGINRRTTISTHDSSAKINIGDNCGMSGVVIGSKESITIGKNAVVGANVLITDFDWHAIDAVARNKGESSKSSPVVISDNVFIGTSAIILKGVHIGENSVIGANSVVTSDIPANVIAAGNPCKIVSKLN